MSLELHERLSALSDAEAAAALARCCGSQRWVAAMLAARPFAATSAVLEAADRIWAALGRADYLEAFAHHPRIGADLAALRARYASTAAWSHSEQSGVSHADEQTLEALRGQNLAYEVRFGYIFIVCATGKSAREMLALLSARLQNTPDVELAIAAAEQAKIMRLRLARLADE